MPTPPRPSSCFSLALLAVVACRVAQAPAEPSEVAAVPSAPTQDARASLGDIADAIDPGPLDPITDGLPGWLLSAIGVPSPLPGDAAELQRRADEEWRAFETSGPGQTEAQQLATFLALARSVVYAEQAAARGPASVATLVRLERAYDMIDAPMLAGQRGFFQTMFQMFVQAAATEGHIQEAAAVQQLSDAVFAAVREAGDLHARTLAQLLREGPEHESVPQALLRGAANRIGVDDALAVRMVKAAVEHLGDDADPAPLARASTLCFQALDPGCGEAMLARAEDRVAKQAKAGAGADATQAAEEAEKEAEKVANAIAGAKSNRDLVVAAGASEDASFDDRVAAARALMDLGRHDDALRAYEALRRESPKDARPVTGLARHAIATRLDMQAAIAIIDAAGEVDNADEDYYAIAIGTRATGMLYDVLPKVVAESPGMDQIVAVLMPMLDDLRRDILALEKLGDSNGAFLHFVFDIGMEGLAAVQTGAEGAAVPVLRGSLKRTMDLQAQIPDNPHAYTLMLAALQFCDDRGLTTQAAARAAPGEGEAKTTLQVRRLQALIDMAATWADADASAALLAAIAELDGKELGDAPKLVLADAHATYARLGHAEAWDAVLARYEELIGDPAAATDARALNNYGVALQARGRTKDAIVVLERAFAVAEPDVAGMPALNLQATRQGPDAVAVLEAIVAANKDAGTTRAALMWLVSVAKDRAQRKAYAADLKSRQAEARKTDLRPVVLPTEAAVVLAGNLQVNVGYATLSGLQIQIDGASTPWLIVAPPSR